MHAPARHLFFTSLALAASAGVVVTIAAQGRTAHAQGGAAAPQPVPKSTTGCSCACCAGLTPLSEWPAGVDVFNELKRETVIVQLLPEGTAVKKGDVVCQLNAFDLEADVVGCAIASKEAEAGHANAKLNREIAEIAVTQYLEGIYLQEETTALAEVELAKRDVKNSEVRLAEATQLFEAGHWAKDRVISAQLGLQRAEISLEMAETKLKVLREYTKDKTVKELKSEVETARGVEWSHLAKQELETAKLQRLKRDIERHKLRAPADGIVRHAQGVGPDGRPRIEEGAIVKYRQWIFRIVTGEDDSAPKKSQ
jgi:HlyD family secretion protein